jgi:hypothetical protein
MSMNPQVAALVAILANLAMVSPPDPERRFLFDRGWVPFGANATTGLEGWGKMIDGAAVIVDQPEALAREGWPGGE